MFFKVFKSKWFYFIIIFLFMLFFNFLTPYIMDDYQYMFTSKEEEINNIFQIIIELKDMYFNWGGRVLAHFFAYSFLALPKWIFNIINSIIYVINIYLIYLISRGKKEDNYSYLLLIHMIVFIFFPVFGQVFLWLDGSCNYSFTLLIQLFFIYKVLNIKDNKYNYIIYFIISLFAGMCNENSSLSLIVFLVLYSIIYDRNNIKLKGVSLIGLVIGYLFLFLAPGNYVRMLTYGDNASLFNNILSKVLYLIITFWPVLIGIFLLIIVFYLKNRNRGKLCILLYLSSLVAFFSMIASPQLNLRSYTMPAIYLFIIMMIMIFNNNRRSITRIVFVLISLLFLYISFDTVREYISYYEFINKREEKIYLAKKNNLDKVIVPIYKQSNNCRIPPSCEFEDIDIDKDDFPNYYISRYYGIDVYGK